MLYQLSYPVTWFVTADSSVVPDSKFKSAEDPRFDPLGGKVTSTPWHGSVTSIPWLGRVTLIP